MRVFSSSPILRRHDVFTLETTDGIYVRILGLINKTRTEENGFPSEVFRLFSISTHVCFRVVMMCGKVLFNLILFKLLPFISFSTRDCFRVLMMCGKVLFNLNLILIMLLPFMQFDIYVVSHDTMLRLFFFVIISYIWCSETILENVSLKCLSILHHTSSLRILNKITSSKYTSLNYRSLSVSFSVFLFTGKCVLKIIWHKDLLAMTSQKVTEDFTS